MTMDGDGSYFRENSLTELHFLQKDGNFVRFSRK